MIIYTDEDPGLGRNVCMFFDNDICPTILVCGVSLSVIRLYVINPLFAANRKKKGRSVVGGGGQEKSVKDIRLPADKGMNQTPNDDYTLMDMNPAYQSTETAVHTYA